MYILFEEFYVAKVDKNIFKIQYQSFINNFMALDTYASYNVNIFHLNLSVNRNLNPRVTGILISIH